MKENKKVIIFSAYKWKKMMIFGKEIKGRKIKFINLISNCLNGKANRPIHIATTSMPLFI